jgi:carboxyl-terminal processing protease
MERRGLRNGLGLLALIAVIGLSWRGTPVGEPVPPEPNREAKAPSAGPDAQPEPDAAECAARPLRVPSGGPPRIACDDARAVVRDVHARFAVSSEGPPLGLFVDLLIGWLDPHGLWSAAPDAPTRQLLRESASALLGELRGAPDGSRCEAAERVGVELARWIAELDEIYGVGYRAKAEGSRARAHALAIEPVFEDDPVTMPARVLSRSLGERLARLSRAYPALGEDFANSARARYFPKLDGVAWGEAVLSAELRAYVAALDPHGAWTPLDEEWSLYADEPGFDAGPRLWGRVTRSAAGVRIVDEPVAPLAIGDLVLTVDGVRTAGMPLEQVEQLSRIDPPAGTPRHVLVLHAHSAEPEELEIAAATEADPGEEPEPLETERVRYGNSQILVVHLPSVADGVDDAFARSLEQSDRDELDGILIDLRGNGGGSTDAALGVLGLFLPDAPLFPLAQHGHVVEVMRALNPHEVQPWPGPVAALVDGRTASAAEMIAGALSAYRRGPVVGSRTFGKGCIQEYTDDPTGQGVLRLTSLLFALPDGSPLQGIGITPNLLLSLPKASAREASVPGSLPSYTGPDVRAEVARPWPAWPRHQQRVGPCQEPVVCAALARIGDAETRDGPHLRRARRK